MANVMIGYDMVWLCVLCKACRDAEVLNPPWHFFIARTSLRGQLAILLHLQSTLPSCGYCWWKALLHQLKIVQTLEFGDMMGSGQIIIFHQPRFFWNNGISLTKPPFGVRSCEVVIICPDGICIHQLLQDFVKQPLPQQGKGTKTSTISTHQAALVVVSSQPCFAVFNVASCIIFSPKNTKVQQKTAPTKTLNNWLPGSYMTTYVQIFNSAVQQNQVEKKLSTLGCRTSSINSTCLANVQGCTQPGCRIFHQAEKNGHLKRIPGDSSTRKKVVHMS